jgi:hypothetical protein
MAKRLKNLRKGKTESFGDWDPKNEDRRKEKERGKKIKSRRKDKNREKFQNFKDFSEK